MPETSTQTFPESGYVPSGGVNKEDNESYIGENEVQDARNFLFERNQALTRPGLSSAAITGMPGLTLLYAASLVVNSTYYTLLYTTTNRLFFLTGTGVAATEITGAGLTQLATSVDFRPISIQGQVLFPGFQVTGGNNTPIWNPTGGPTYTGFAAQLPLFMTSCYSRAVAANETQGANGQYIVEWSKTGDVTTWNTAGGVDGSGSVTLVDLPDSINGIYSLHNIVVLLRSSGVHLGMPTGQGLNPFRWEPYSRDRIGAQLGDTTAAAMDSNILYFVGPDNVYTFDLQSLQDFGYKIRTSLISIFDAQGSTGTATYAGFVGQKVTNGQYRLRYYLVPVGGQAALSPWFVFDIKDKTWSLHSHNKVINWGFYWIRSPHNQSPAFIDNTNTPTIWYWDNNVACEQQAYFVSPSWRQDPRRDLVCQRVLMSSRDYNQAGQVTVLVTGRLGDTAESQSDTKALGTNGDGKWIRTWFNTRQPVGQDFSVKVTVPANNKFATDYIACELSESGGFRG